MLLTTCNIDTEEYVNELLERIQYLRTEVKRYKYDFLTGLKMRMDFDGYLKALFEMFEFESRPFTLIIVDVDGLHDLNRAEGYFAGDQLIKKVAKSLLETFAECNGTEVFRIGGDEFAVLIKGHSQERLETALSTLKNCSYAYAVVSEENSFASPSDVFRKTDNELISKKNSRKS